MNGFRRRFMTGVQTLWVLMLVSWPAYAESMPQFDKPKLSDLKNFLNETANNIYKIITNPWFFAFLVFFGFFWWRFTRGWQKKE